MARVAQKLVTSLLLALPLSGATAAAAPLQPGEIIVVLQRGGTNKKGSIYRINPDTGMRQQITDFGNAAQGADPLSGPTDAAVIADERLLVTTINDGQDGAACLVDIDTGIRTVLSAMSNQIQGEPSRLPASIAVTDTGQIVVLGAVDQSGLPRRVLQPGTRASRHGVFRAE